MNNWFEVGEEVVMQSISNPQYNGKSFVIKRIMDKGEVYKDRLTDKLFHMTDGPGFQMEQILVDATEIDGREAIYSHSALRKKHRPSNESFKDMLARLNTNSNVNILEGVL